MEHQILRKFNFSSRQNFAEQVWFPLRKCIPDRKSKEKSIFAHKGWFSPTARKIIPPVEAIMVARGLPAPTRHQLKMIKIIIMVIIIIIMAARGPLADFPAVFFHISHW